MEEKKDIHVNCMSDVVYLWYGSKDMDRCVIQIKQDSIPIGCVPPACEPYGGAPPVNRMSDRCKNITLPKPLFCVR